VDSHPKIQCTLRVFENISKKHYRLREEEEEEEENDGNELSSTVERNTKRTR